MIKKIIYHRLKISGFSLFEVLVALFVFSLGIVGLGALQSISLSGSARSYHYSVAVSKALNMEERMVANKAGFDAGYYNNPTPIQYTKCYTTAGCTALEMAQNDYYEWRTYITNNLPSGVGTICIDSNGTSACDGVGTTHVVIVTWSDGTQSRSVNIPVKM